MASDFSRQRLEEGFHLQTSMRHLIHQFLSRGLKEVGPRLPEKRIHKSSKKNSKQIQNNINQIQRSSKLVQNKYKKSS